MPERELGALAAAAAGGDRDALTQLIRLTQHDLVRFLAPLCGPGEAEDLAQETYLRAIRALPEFEARSSVRTWLFAIGRRVAADAVRKATRRPRIASLADWRTAADTAAEHDRFEEQHALGDLLAALAPERREAFVATQISGLSYAEAAQVCGCPVGTVRSRVARAREDLVAAMHGDGWHRSATG
ncbi:sigma-70 family RNA polymerase sigma factor [Actinoplanes sp. NPDC051346]|uniref:sigma-70 family RNA polymerase sigma factor n=1 Tax=Actinoplanes sp. NPDC051346 TaxID=3155048 RepID=UPI003436F4D6